MSSVEPDSMRLGSLLAKITNGVSNAELVHVPHPRWPLPQHSQPQPQPTRPLRIAVLDASFNPPTLAHLALINSPRPSTTTTAGGGDEDYDAKLLLLSVRNVDKSLKPTDATYIQRLQMMHLLTQHVRPSSPSSSVAIGIINEPTFIGKSTFLLDFLKSRVSASSTTPTLGPIGFELSFILGLDTLERVVAPRYYPSQEAMLTSLRRFFSPTEENSLVVCARRNLSNNDGVQEEGKLALAQEFIKAGRVSMIDIGEDESTYSSTAVRNAIKQLGLGEESQKVWRKYVPTNVADYIVKEGLYVGDRESPALLRTS